jgi:hypothetical protein
MRTLRQADGWYVEHDGCIVIRWANVSTGEKVSQRKRRRAGVEVDQCTWHPSLHCADHPSR